MDHVYVYQECSGGSKYISQQESVMSFDRTAKNGGALVGLRKKANEIICCEFIVSEC